MSAKILYLDIETAPNLALFFGSLWRQNISLAQLRESSRVICVGWKWRGKGRIHFASEYHDGREAMLARVHEALSEADVVATYNGKSFDVPVLSWDFARAGMLPPAPFQQLDLLQTMKRRFRATSNKLDHVVKELGIGSKVEHEGFELWVRCLMNDDAAWSRMRRYCKHDVALLEPLHDRLMPWLYGAPNARLYAEDDTDVCPSCGSSDLRREGHRYTALGRYQRYQCRTCGAWSTASRRDAGTDIRGIP